MFGEEYEVNYLVMGIESPLQDKFKFVFNPLTENDFMKLMDSKIEETIMDEIIVPITEYEPREPSMDDIMKRLLLKKPHLKKIKNNINIRNCIKL